MVIPAKKREDDLVKQAALVEVDDKGELPFRLTIDIVLSRLALFCNLCCVTCVLLAYLWFVFVLVPVCMSLYGEHICKLSLLCDPCLLTEIDNLILCILGKEVHVSFIAKVFICLKENCVWLGTHYPTK